MISYIGSTFGWLGSGVSSYGASYLGAQATAAEGHDGEEDATMKGILANVKETGDAVDKSSSSNSEDEFQDAIDVSMDDE